MKARQKVWFNTFSEVWAYSNYNADFTGYAAKMADEALEEFDRRDWTEKEKPIGAKQTLVGSPSMWNPPNSTYPVGTE